MSADGRPYDVVLFGATGFTGELTAVYLARTVPAGTKWALAGRNREKLEALRSRLAQEVPAAADVPLLQADADDPASLREVAEHARVVITTVGPYIKYGAPLVAACAAAGTDYVDLTGEPEFVDLMWLRHHAEAERTGARIVHCCGFDSIPHDLGALFTVGLLPEGVPLRVEGLVRVGGTPSGGTFETAVTGLARFRQGGRVAKERREREERPQGRKVHGERRGVRRAPGGLDGWAVPLPTVDPQIVLRSARALERYGPDFTYGHYLVLKHLPQVAALAGGVSALFAAAQVPPARRLLLRLRPAGTGPSEEQRERGWFKVRFVGEGGGRRVVTEVSGESDPGYSETSKMLAEAALCLAHDDLPPGAGQLTPAAAMGERLIERLQGAGIAFSVLEQS